MSADRIVPQFISAKTAKELSAKIWDVQIKNYGKVAIISMYYDPSQKVHICWYYERTGQVVSGL